MIAGTLRLECYDQPIRITEISPGLVATEEFSLTRFGGDREGRTRCTTASRTHCVAEDVADAITWMATRPAHVNIDRLTIRPVAQAAQHKLFRGTYA